MRYQSEDMFGNECTRECDESLLGCTICGETPTMTVEQFEFDWWSAIVSCQCGMTMCAGSGTEYDAARRVMEAWNNRPEDE